MVQRGDFVPPRQFDPSLDMALEAVCLKAMATRPEDRYSSCRALAEDLERWMADEPVSAWREPWTRTLVRWLTRHRVSVTAAGAAVLVALVGTAAVLAVQTRANTELQAANYEMAVANMKVSRANVDLAAANERERARFALAQEAIRTFHSGVSEDVLLKQNEFDALRTKLLRGARDFYRKLENLLEGQADRVSRKALGRAYLEIAEISATIESRDAAVAVARNAAALFEALSREDAADVDARRELARSWNLFARHRYGQDGGKDECRTAFARVRQLLEPLANAQPPDAQAQRELADTYEALAFDLSIQTGHADKGLELMSRARAILEDLAKAEPSDVQLLSRLASLCSTQGLMLSSAGRLDAAISTHERGRDILEGLVRANPTDAKIGHDLVRALGNMAVDVDRRTGPEDRESLAILERSLAVCEDMAKANPTVLNFPRDKAWIDLCLANTLIGMGREQEGRPRLEEARALREQLLKTNPNDIRNQTQLHQVLLTPGSLSSSRLSATPPRRSPKRPGPSA
jgi:tetratricopeptide (TPR) repeat protein